MDDHAKLSAMNAPVDRPREAATAAKQPKLADLRVRRLQDMVAEALEDADPLRANLRAAVADLMEIGYRLGDAVKATMSSSRSLDAVETVMPAIANMALVHRQATRYIQLGRDQAADDTSDGPDR
jgi:hypothetical protein